jgi:hypothetical protein
VILFFIPGQHIKDHHLVGLFVQLRESLGRMWSFQRWIYARFVDELEQIPGQGRLFGRFHGCTSLPIIFYVSLVPAGPGSAAGGFFPRQAKARSPYFSLNCRLVKFPVPRLSAGPGAAF